MNEKTSSGKPEKVAKQVKASSANTQYLIAYNLVSALLWSGVLVRTVLTVGTEGFEGTYPNVGEYTKWTQTLAGMEVLHALIGVVRAPISTTAMQVASRFLLVWGIVNNFPYLASSPAYSSMLVAWSVTEVIRYGYFVMTLSGFLPAAMKWLRYNTFFVLYPLGISSECWLVYKAIGPAGEWSQLYAYYLIGVLLVYVPGSYILFTHMMKQRSKVMKGKQAEKPKKDNDIWS